MTRIRKDEKGQALLIVLVSLFVGGILTTACIGYTDTMLRRTYSKEESDRGLYAADGGVEDVLWCLKNSVSPRAALPQNLNGMQVAINTINQGAYSLIAGTWQTTGGSHASDLHISSSMVWDAGAAAYKYTITCEWVGPGECKLLEVGARLPIGYDYEPGSAATFGGNLAGDEPSRQLDSQGAYMISWDLPQVPIETRTQIFYATGSGALENDYGWAEAKRSDVGEVGELIGTFYIITATATNPVSGRTTATIVADVKMTDGSVSVVSWRINPQ